MIGTIRQRRLALAFLDQSFSSGSNFLTGVMVARLSGPAEFGNYMLALMAWLIAVGVHRALVSEPVIVATAHVDDQRALLARGVSAELLLGALISGVVALGALACIAAGLSIGVPGLALSPWFIPLLVQDYWRAMAFQQRRPGLALANDVLFVAVQIAAIVLFLALGWRSPVWMITAWGLGGVAGALAGFRWFPFLLSAREGSRLAARLWPVSRWLLADVITSFASQQAYLAFVALLLPRADYGGFRAALNLMGPAIVIVHAAANLGLPEASRLAGADDRAGLRRLARRLSGGSGLCIAVYGLVVAVSGSYVLRTVYGAEFGRFGPLAMVVALEGVILVSVFGQTIALKATGRTRALWRARLVVAATSLVLALVLVPWLGAIGAAWAGVGTAVSYAVAVFVAYRSKSLEPSIVEPREHGAAIAGATTIATSTMPEGGM